MSQDTAITFHFVIRVQPSDVHEDRNRVTVSTSVRPGGINLRDYRIVKQGQDRICLYMGEDPKLEASFLLNIIHILDDEATVAWDTSLI